MNFKSNKVDETFFNNSHSGVDDLLFSLKFLITLMAVVPSNIQFHNSSTLRL